MTYLVTSALRKTTEMRRRLALNSLRALSSVSTSSRGHVNNSFAASNEAAARYFSSSPSGDGDNTIPANWLTEDGFTQFDTLHEMISRSTRVFADNELFGTYSAESNQFEWITFQDYEEKVHQCRSALKDLDVGPYSKIGIISNNRWEWACIAAAAYSLNANIVPMYEAQLPTDWTYILNDSGASVLFCATQEIFDACQNEVLPSTPSVKSTICLDAPLGEPHAFSTVMAEAGAGDVSGQYIQEPVPEDLANLIYTSGTTGKPKGVELTHHNFTTNVLSAGRSMVNNPNEMICAQDRTLAFLPWAHSYGQTCELWMSISHGASMGICRGVPSILEDLQLVKPTILFAVPTLHKKVYDGVNNLMESASPLRKGLMTKALYLGGEQAAVGRGERGPLGFVEKMQYSALNKIVLSKIRDRFGGQLRHGFVAGAACPKEVLDFMDAIGIKICEGYGLTETSPIIAINTPTQRCLGSVGRPIGGVSVYVIGENGDEVAVGEEGEICCTGPNVMRGYHKNQEATDEVISTAPDGVSRMFHTGDLGRLGEDGFVKITGRLKEQYKLENGKYVVPTPIEEAIGLSRFIQQVVLCGSNRPYNVALLVPEWTSIRAHLNIEDSVSEEDLANDENVRLLIDDEIARTTQQLKKFEVPTAWAFVAPFTAANNMLTPKMSIRRHKVTQYYAETIGNLYGDDPIVSDETPSEEANVA